MKVAVYHGQEIHIQYIPLDKIRPNPYQPRRVFEQEQLEELATSIKEYGVMQPINIRCINGTSYELVTGERRLRASKLAGLETIPAIIIEITDKDSAVIALIENLQRQDLNYLEEGEGYQNLMLDYGITQEELAKKLGKSQSTIANKLRILKLAPKIKKMLLDNHLSERHARALLKIPDEKLQFETIEKVIKLELNVKATDELVDKIIQKILDNNLPKEEQKEKRYIGDIRLFTNTIKQAVDIMNKSGVEAMYLMEQRDHVYEIKINIPM